ncbi:MAG: HAD-IA family hydrolase [Candidatus Methylacidiphilales bacterium]|nr:HAD-IA family hydrolase [Candidatus Methylacidiphilales bacterium]
MNPVRVIFFDAGGTLIHPVKPVGHVYAEVARRFGVEADGDRLQQGFKQAWKAQKPRDPVAAARVSDDRAWWCGIVRRAWDGQEPPADFEAYFDAVYRDFAEPSLWCAFPEVEGVVERCVKLGYRCAVLSNWDRRLRTTLAGFAWSRHFEDLLISAEIGFEKPHPGFFRAAEERLGIKAGEAILWGDDPVCDGEGARGAGWRSALLDRPNRDLCTLLEELTVSNRP